MSKEYRAVSTDKRGYFVLYGDRRSSAWDRVRAASQLGSKDALGPSKVQYRAEGAAGNDSTWTDDEAPPVVDAR